MKVKFIAFALTAFFVFSVSSCSNKQKSESEPTDEEVIAEPDEDMEVLNPEADVPEEGFTIEAVDMGVSVLWANANIGANSVYDVGEYFAWGESSPKSSYTLDNYFDYQIEVKEGGYVHRSFKKFTETGQSLIGTDYDTANSVLGNGWRMPSSDEYNELRDNCRTEIDYLKDGNGNRLRDENGNLLPKYVSIKAPYGNTILFPFGGYKEADSSTGSDGFYYWSANLNHRGTDDAKAMAACLQDYTRGIMMVAPHNRGYGMNIRAVKDRDASTAIIKDGGYEMAGRVGNIIVSDFELIINGPNVTGKYLYSTANFNNYIELEGTKDEHNNITLKETFRGEDMGKMEGVFDGWAFRGIDYHTDGDGYMFKVVVKRNK